MINTSPNPEAAQAFIAWILSPEGQEPWLDPTVNRLPVNTKVFETEKGKERPDLEEMYYKSLDALKIDFNEELADSYQYSMQNFFKYTLLKPWNQLQEAWYQLAQAKINGDISSVEFRDFIDQLSNPLLFEFIDPATGQLVTFTEDYAISINQHLIDDSEFTTTMTNLWRETAVARYNSVKEQVLSIIP